jgi:hypothetical protein
MVRTQIQLTEEQSLRLKEMAAEQNVSMAALIRQSVDRFLETSGELSREEKYQKLLSLAGKYASGASDLAENHDEYLDEIYGDFGA